MRPANIQSSPIQQLTFIYLSVGVLAFAIRLFFNFSQELIPGVNGGYYPVQVRAILKQGSLSFADMPLLFYLDAGIIKMISLLNFSITDDLILNVVKLIDSISVPILLIPLYKISRYEKDNLTKAEEFSLVCFAVLSFSPLILLSDLQKNAVAIIFALSCLACMIGYQHEKKALSLILACIFLVLAGLTHFGTFSFLVFFLLLYVGFTFKRKAIVPLMVTIAVSLAMVAFFDIKRFNRLISIGTLAFQKPALTNGTLSTPDLLIVSFSVLLAIAGISVMVNKKKKLPDHQRGILFANIVCLLLFSFVLLDTEYFRRLSLFLFIPQILTALYLYSNIHRKIAVSLLVSLLFLTGISILAVIGRRKEVVIHESAYDDLKNLNSIIKKDNKTIVIARHGLEWWIAWALELKVGQDKAMTGDFYSRYKNIYFIHQLNTGSTKERRTQFREPLIPPNADCIYSSTYFNLYHLK